MGMQTIVCIDLNICKNLLYKQKINIYLILPLTIVNNKRLFKQLTIRLIGGFGYI